MRDEEHICNDCGNTFQSECESCVRKDEACIKKLVQHVVESKKIREVDISDGSRVKHGSSKHIKDLETRINDLTMWRNKQRRGSEARANYSRLIARLKGELSSARKRVKQNTKGK